MGDRKNSLRDEIIKEAARQYGSLPEHLWSKFPEYGILRHADNRKWFAVFMNVERSKLGLEGEGEADILNVKTDPEMTGLLAGTPGYLPAYHMHKGNWLTILLDGTVKKENVLSLLDMSFELTGGKKSGNRAGSRITDWIIPANPKYYDIQSDIAQNPDKPFIWKQSSRVQEGDIVYIYLGAPIRAILYKCRAVEVDIPYRYSDENLTINRAMRLQCIEQYAEDFLTIERLKEHGVYAVRGPRSMPRSLAEEIKGS